MPTSTYAPEKTIVLSRSGTHVRKFAELKPVQAFRVADIQKSIQEIAGASLWISFEAALTNTLLRSSVCYQSKSLGNALLLHHATPEIMPALQKCFGRVAFCSDGKFLEDDELCEVLKSPRRDELFIGGFADNDSRTVTLWRGNLDNITVPFTAFPRSGDGIVPDFSKLAITDCGQTVQFGDYEASTDSILYEYDAEYRKKAKKNLVDRDPSFGGSIRRLRKQRQLRRKDFVPLTEKTIGRIERGETKQVQPQTRKILAEKLGVKPEELGSF